VGNGSNTTARIMGFGDYEMITGVSGATYLRVSGSNTLAGTLQSGQYILAAGLAYGSVNNFTQIIDGSTAAITGTTAAFTGMVTTNSRFNASTQALHFPNHSGTQGWQIGSDSTANGMYIYNENGVYAMKLTKTGNATFGGLVSSVGISSTIASATSGYFATTTAIPANQIVHVRDDVATTSVSSAGGIKISSSPGNDVFLLKRWDHSGSASYFSLRNNSNTEHLAINMASGNATFGGDVLLSSSKGLYTNVVQAVSNAGLKLGNDDNSQYIFIKDDTGVGIGTTSPSEKLTLQLDAQNQAFSGKNGTDYLWFLRNEAGAGARQSGRFQLMDTDVTTVNIESASNRNTYFNAGNVGIGTTSPDAKLEVLHSTYSNTNETATFINGNLPVRVTYDTVVVAQSDVPCLSIIETVGASNQATEQKLTFAVGDGSAVIGSSSTVTNGIYINTARATSSAGYLTTNGTNSARFLNNGYAIFPVRVGIGTTTPGSKLEVITSGANSVVELDNSDTNYTLIQYNASGATKGFSGFNAGFMLFGGEAGTW